MGEGDPSEKSTLSTGRYSIEFSDGPSHVYKKDEEDNKIWVCTTTDPEAAMVIVEGLILVEQKRFYYPESKPQVDTEVKTTAQKG